MAEVLAALVWVGIVAELVAGGVSFCRRRRPRPIALPPLKTVAEYLGDDIPWDADPALIVPVRK